MPETQTIEVDFSFESNEFGQDYESALNDNESELLDVPENDALEETASSNPITEAIRPYGGEHSEITERKENVMEIKDGELVDIESGKSLTQMLDAFGSDADKALHQDMMRQWQEGGSNIFVNPVSDPEYFPGGERYYITTMILGDDGRSVSYETRTITTLYKDEGEAPVRDEGFTDPDSQAWSRQIEIAEVATEQSETQLLSMDQAAAVEVQEPGAVEEFAAPITQETQPAFVEITPTISDAEQPIQNSYVGQQINAQVLGEFLAMERLPSITLEHDFSGSIILKAPEPAPVDHLAVQQRAIVRVTESTHEVEPRGFEAATIPSQAVELDEMVLETIEETVAEESEAILEKKVEASLAERPLAVEDQKVEVQELQLPTYDFTDEIEEKAPAVVEQKAKPVIENAKEVPQEVKAGEQKGTEIFKGRRGRERYTVEPSAKRNYEEPAEAIQTARPSIAESAVEQTLARFAAEMARERPIPVEDTHREPVAEAKIVVANENDPVVEVAKENTQSEITEQKPVVATETPLLIREEVVSEQQSLTAEAARRATVAESDNVVPFPAFARTENAPKTQIENILEQLRLPRTATNAEIVNAHNESLRTISTRSFPVTDDSDKRPRTRTVKSGPIKMSIAA